VYTRADTFIVSPPYGKNGFPQPDSACCKGFFEAVDFVRTAVRGVSNGHGRKVVHFCTTLIPIASDFTECGANLHHMKPFRRFGGTM
jgi:hypothetical protein